MSYYIEDCTGRYAEVEDLSDIERLAGEALTEFLETGEADDDLVEQIRDELDGLDELSYLKKVFNGSPPFNLVEREDG